MYRREDNWWIAVDWLILFNISTEITKIDKFSINFLLIHACPLIVQRDVSILTTKLTKRRNSFSFLLGHFHYTSQLWWWFNETLDSHEIRKNSSGILRRHGRNAKFQKCLFTSQQFKVRNFKPILRCWNGVFYVHIPWEKSSWK